MTPGNTAQTGPARIVSLSADTGAQNFTLGQEGSDIEFRLRTPVSGRNGIPLAVRELRRDIDALRSLTWSPLIKTALKHSMSTESNRRKFSI